MYKPLKLETLKRLYKLSLHPSTIDKALQSSTIRGIINDDLLLGEIKRLEKYQIDLINSRN